MTQARLAALEALSRQEKAQKKAGAAAHAASEQKIERIATAVKTPGAAAVKSDRAARESYPAAGAAEASDAASIREALARRRAWTEPRQNLLEPAKVQDPPAVVKEEHVAASAPAAHEAPRETRVAGAGIAERVNNEDLIREALQNRNARYVWGGASRGSFDCSGFICYLFLTKRGVKLPHSASAQARMGKPVRFEQLQPGDVVFFRTYRPGISHVGLFIGNNRFIHAANSRKNMRIDSFTGYYAHRLKAARRISPAPIEFTPEELKGFESSETPAGEDE